MGHNKNIRKQDCSIKIEPQQRLQCHLCRKIRRITQVKKRTGLLPQLPILRQVPSCLSHQPDRSTDWGA